MSAHFPFVKWLAIGLTTIFLLGSCAHVDSGSATKPLNPALRKLVADVCDAQMVFLGEEGSHGGAAAFTVKALVIEQLIQRCGFRHVAFESQIYDFENLKQRYAAGTATKAALLDAVGALWSTSSELDRFFSDLHAQASAGHLVLSGIDGQIGSSTGMHTQQRLGAEISAAMKEPARDVCKKTIDRLAAWSFDAEHPYDEPFKKQIVACAEQAQIAVGEASSSTDTAKLLTKSFRDYLSFADATYANQRDRLMYENLDAIVRALPAGTKTVVWTANVHALREAYADTKSTASYLASSGRSAVKSIGIVAIAGHYGRQGRAANQLEPAIAGSLDGSAAPSAASVMRYVSANDLLRYDQWPSRLLGYSDYQRADWAKLFDGVLVLHSEHQPDFIRSQKAQHVTE